MALDPKIPYPSDPDVVITGDAGAVELLIDSVRDTVYRLALRYALDIVY